MTNDTTRPLYYKSTGKPLEYLGAEPVIKHRVRWPGGTEVLLSDEKFQATVTNQRPEYCFDFYTGGSTGFRARGLPNIGNFLRVNMASRFGAGRAQTDLDTDQVRTLATHMLRWLADRDSAPINVPLSMIANLPMGAPTEACAEVPDVLKGSPHAPLTATERHTRAMLDLGRAPWPEPWE